MVCLGERNARGLKALSQPWVGKQTGQKEPLLIGQKNKRKVVGGDSGLIKTHEGEKWVSNLKKKKRGG